LTNMNDTMRWTGVRMVDGYSLEMTAKDGANLIEAQTLIPAGTSISITYLPGEDLDARVAAASLVRKLGFTPVPHISARRIPSVAALNEYLQRLKDGASIDRAFVVAGDLSETLGPYGDALSLIDSGLLQEHGVRKIGIAGYPEGHPEIEQDKLWEALRMKVRCLSAAGIPYEIATQFAFDPGPVLEWLKRIRAEGIEGRVRIGVPGPANVKTLLRFAGRCGVGASTKVMAKYGLSLTKLLSTTGPDNLLEEFKLLLDPAVHGDVQFHFYPFGGFSRTATWVHAYGRSE